MHKQSLKLPDFLPLLRQIFFLFSAGFSSSSRSLLLCSVSLFFFPFLLPSSFHIPEVAFSFSSFFSVSFLHFQFYHLPIQASDTLQATPTRVGDVSEAYRCPIRIGHRYVVAGNVSVLLRVGPYQPKLNEYPRIEGKKQARRFQKKWFDEFPWLEYSPSIEMAYCFYCFLFQKDDNSSRCSGLVTEGYNNWKRVKDGSKCAFLIHANSSYHKFCETRAKDLIKPSQHIDKVMQPVLEEELQKRRLRIITSIKSVQWLAFQGLGFIGNDESPSSLNRGNFIQLIKYAADLNPEISEVVLENTPQNAQYIAPTFQKEILHIMANRVRRMIREEIGDECFCILVDEAQDASNREQMAIILRFVNRHGSLIELLSLSAALDPKDLFRSFDNHKICTLADKFYPQDFSNQDIITLQFELTYYELDMKGELRFHVSTLAELCTQLTESRRSESYIMVSRLIRLVLTLPISIASTERAFSAMKHVKTTLRNKMEDDFLADCMILFIEKELTEKIDLDSVINEYYVSNPRRERLK